jgi:hypothetical protein
MNFQAIRASMESPILTAFNNLSTPVPVFFDNITATPANSTTEFVRVNVQFGLTNETLLSDEIDNVSGTLVVQVFTEKGRGPARNQELISVASDVIEALNNTAKTSTGVYTRVGPLSGPSFSSTEESPHFVGRLEAPYVATDLS